MADQLFAMTADTKAKVEALLAKNQQPNAGQSAASGPGVSSGNGGTTINPPANRRGPADPLDDLWHGQVITDAIGGGKYNAKTFIGRSSSVTATGDLSASDLGTLSTAEDTLFLNLEEVGASTHELTVVDGVPNSLTPYAIGRIIGYTSDTPAKKVVVGLSLATGCSS